MRLHLAALLTLAALAGCSSSSTDDTDDQAAGPASSLPACADVWQAGDTLPDGYAGCADGDTDVAAVWVECKAGGRYTSYDDALFALEGGPILETAGDVADLYNRCTG